MTQAAALVLVCVGSYLIADEHPVIGALLIILGIQHL